MKSFSSVAILAVLLRHSTALQGWPSQGTIVDGNAYRFDQKTWERNLAQPNATGDFSIQGYDISQKFPSEQVDGWTLSVNVTSSMPDTETLSNSSSGKVYTGTSLFLKAPDGISTSSTLSDPDETTWKICITVMTNGPGEETATADNGTCGSLSSQCIADFQNAYAEEFAKQQDCYRLPATPSSCGDSLNAANLTTQQFPISSSNGTEIFVTASDAHDAGDDTAFDSAVKQVWPVLTVWGWNTRANATDGTTPTVQLTCARANTAAPGSSTSPSSASVSQSSAVAALVVSGLAAVYLF